MSILERMPTATTPAPRPLPPRAPHHPQPAAALDHLPLDPRVWSRREVATWVSAAGAAPERFPMNGKALCLMSAAMFAARVPHSARAAYLYHDFRRRLSKALALQELLDEMSAHAHL